MLVPVLFMLVSAGQAIETSSTFSRTAECGTHLPHGLCRRTDGTVRRHVLPHQILATYCTSQYAPLGLIHKLNHARQGLFLAEVDPHHFRRATLYLSTFSVFEPRVTLHYSHSRTASRLNFSCIYQQKPNNRTLLLPFINGSQAQRVR